MSVVALASLIERLPPGRARTRYQRLLAETGGDMLAVTVLYADAPLWFVTGVVQAKALTERGIPRWRIWTLNEANSFLEACASVPATVSEAARCFESVGPQEARPIA